MGRAKSEATRFIDHVQELRKRLVWVVLTLIAGSAAGYALLDKLIELLSKPLSQKLYYSAPTGQFSFIIKVCILFGVIVAAPTIIYHVARFLEPLFQKKTKLRILRYTFAAVAMAGGGILFAYFLSLPLTLQFLTGEQDSTAGIIAPLISADEYFNFVIAYIAGFAILFQVPLVVMIINSIKPLDPGSFIGSLRYVILISFVLSAIITPTPDPINQAIMAGPVIVLYIASFLMIIIGRLLARNKTKAKSPASQMKPEPEAKKPNPVASAPQNMPLPSRKPTLLSDFAINSIPASKANISPQTTQKAAKNQFIDKPQRRSIDGFTPWQSQKSTRKMPTRNIASPRETTPVRPQPLISDFRFVSS